MDGHRWNVDNGGCEVDFDDDTVIMRKHQMIFTYIIKSLMVTIFFQKGFCMLRIC